MKTNGQNEFSQAVHQLTFDSQREKSYCAEFSFVEQLGLCTVVAGQRNSDRTGYAR
jgi:hypothetical protein